MKRDSTLGLLARLADERHEVAYLLQRAGLVHARAGDRPDDHDVDLVRADCGGEHVPAFVLGERQPRPWRFEHDDAVAERRSGPAVTFAPELHPEERPWALVFDKQDTSCAGDGDAEPVVAGGKVAGEVDAERRLAGAAVAVEHDVAAFRDERAVHVADERSGSGFLDRDEVIEGDDFELERSPSASLGLGAPFQEPSFNLIGQAVDTRPLLRVADTGGPLSITTALSAADLFGAHAAASRSRSNSAATSSPMWVKPQSRAIARGSSSSGSSNWGPSRHDARRTTRRATRRTGRDARRNCGKRIRRTTLGTRLPGNGLSRERANATTSRAVCGSTAFSLPRFAHARTKRARSRRCASATAEESIALSWVLRSLLGSYLRVLVGLFLGQLGGRAGEQPTRLATNCHPGRRLRFRLSERSSEGGQVTGDVT
jgi:hypothetical protein